MFISLKLIRKKINMITKVEFTPVDVKKYAEAIAEYNATSIKDRKDWRDMDFSSVDTPVLYASWNENSEVTEEYILEVIPKWLWSVESYDGGAAKQDAKDYYYDKIPNNDELYKQDLVLQVIYHDVELNEEDPISYDDFISDMKDVLTNVIANPSDVATILSDSKSEN